MTSNLKLLKEYTYKDIEESILSLISCTEKIQAIKGILYILKSQNSEKLTRTLIEVINKNMIIGSFLVLGATLLSINKGERNITNESSL